MVLRMERLQDGVAYRAALPRVPQYAPILPAPRAAAAAPRYHTQLLSFPTMLRVRARAPLSPPGRCTSFRIER